MRASKIAVRAALVCSAAGIACAIWAAVDETPARAADHGTGLLPATVDLAGGLADAHARTIEQPLRRVTKLARPAPAPVRKATQPVERILDAAVDTVRSTTKTPPPADAPPKQLRAPATKPATAPPSKAVPAVALLTGAAPSTVTLDPTRADTTAPAAAAALPCGDDTTQPPLPGHVATREGSGPCVPDGSETSGGLTAVKPPPKTGADQLAATTPTGPATPALLLLGELLPRSDLPTGRTEHPEPGPA